jgi:hypothetical protein
MAATPALIPGLFDLGAANFSHIQFAADGARRLHFRDALDRAAVAGPLVVPSSSPRGYHSRLQIG